MTDQDILGRKRSTCKDPEAFRNMVHVNNKGEVHYGAEKSGNRLEMLLGAWTLGQQFTITPC